MKPKSLHIPHAFHIPPAFHISEQELLLLLDGELSSQEATRVRAHLEACAACQQRRAEMETRLAHVATAYAAQRPVSWDASGPRALLKARLHEERARSGVARHPSFGWMPYGRSLAYASTLLLLTLAVFVLANRAGLLQRAAGPLPLPNPRLTPGLTRQASLTELCVRDNEEVVRDVSPEVQQQVFKEYGINRAASANFEIDYLITPGLGGSDDLKNLWPEPHSDTQWNSYVKDQLEDRLHRMVCEHKIPLEQAQRDIARDWISAYKTYYRTDQPMAQASPAGQTPAGLAEVASLR